MVDLIININFVFMNKVIKQEINKKYSSDIEFAEAYYTMITQLNKIHLTNTEMSLLCYCAVYGTISTPPVRDAYIKEYKVPKGSVYNIVSKLQKLKLMVKIQGKIRVNPALQIDFTANTYNLNISLIKS